MTYFDCVGFHVERAAELEDLAEQAARLGQPLPTEPGFGLRRWDVGGGVQLWVELGPAGEPLGVLPFFGGAGEHHAALVALGADPDHPEEGWAELWVEPVDPAEPYSGRFPLVCDLVDFLCVARRPPSLPTCVDVQLVCFADALVGFQDALEWATGQHQTGFRTPHAFASTWHTSVDELLGRERPEATAWLAGTVRSVQRCHNPLTHRGFLRLQVDVGEVEVDVVSPEQAAPPVQPGWLVQASAWVLGRLRSLERAS